MAKKGAKGQRSRRGRSAAAANQVVARGGQFSKTIRPPVTPPTINERITQTKWCRGQQLANALYGPSPASIAAGFLPNAGVGWSGFRIRRIRIYAPDSPTATGTMPSAESYGLQLILTGSVAVGNVAASTFFVGDGGIYETDGLISNQRARIEAVPSKEFMDKWWQVGDTASTPFTTSTLPLSVATSLDTFIIDLLLDMVSVA